jgi:hypothetical protein
VEVTESDQLSSLLQFLINYSLRGFKSIGPWTGLKQKKMLKVKLDSLPTMIKEVKYSLSVSSGGQLDRTP